MNRSIQITSTFTLILMVILLINLSVVHVFSEDKYAQNPLNRRAFLAAKSQPRGNISAGGMIIAESQKDESTGFYNRYYPTAAYPYGPVVGYFSDIYGASGVESSYHEVLNGTHKSTSQWWKEIVQGETAVGNVELTLLPSAQETATNLLTSSGYEGAAVAIRPSTGEVLAMASTPSFDPAPIANNDTAAASWQELTEDPGNPLLNHATQETLPPGSTFKVITTAAGLDSGFTPSSSLTGASEIVLPGTTTTLENYGGQTCAGGGSVTLQTAFQYSCNTAFVELAVDTGAGKLTETAEGFGVGETYDLGIPMTAGTVGDIPDEAALGQSAIGQRDVSMTVLHNAVVAATVANGGVRMEPHIVSRVVGNDLKVIEETKPKQLATPISEDTAATLTELMRASERNTAGYTGGNIASKTGTAEHGEDSRNSNPHAWYIAFAPGEDIAVAVVVKNGGDRGQQATGGSVAAPVGRSIIDAIRATG